MRCIYCDHEINDETLVPAVDDDAAWAKLALDHQGNDPRIETCEWIETRAHRVGIAGTEGYSGN